VARVRELLRLFNSQEVIISNREIELPFVISVQCWVLGEIEVDALVWGSANWIVECKYRGRQMTVKNLISGYKHSLLIHNINNFKNLNIK